MTEWQAVPTLLCYFLINAMNHQILSAIESTNESTKIEVAEPILAHGSKGITLLTVFVTLVLVKFLQELPFGTFSKLTAKNL